MFHYCGGCLASALVYCWLGLVMWLMVLIDLVLLGVWLWLRLRKDG